jgi:hypothetical protein
MNAYGAITKAVKIAELVRSLKQRQVYSHYSLFDSGINIGRSLRKDTNDKLRDESEFGLVRDTGLLQLLFS